MTATSAATSTTATTTTTTTPNTALMSKALSGFGSKAKTNPIGAAVLAAAAAESKQQEPQQTPVASNSRATSAGTEKSVIPELYITNPK